MNKYTYICIYDSLIIGKFESLVPRHRETVNDLRIKFIFISKECIKMG
jgi:hypothetical protein